MRKSESCDEGEKGKMPAEMDKNLKKQVSAPVNIEDQKEYHIITNKGGDFPQVVEDDIFWAKKEASSGITGTGSDLK